MVELKDVVMRLRAGVILSNGGDAMAIAFGACELGMEVHPLLDQPTGGTSTAAPRRRCYFFTCGSHPRTWRSRR